MFVWNFLWDKNSIKEKETMGENGKWHIGNSGGCLFRQFNRFKNTPSIWGCSAEFLEYLNFGNIYMGTGGKNRKYFLKHQKKREKKLKKTILLA